MGAQADIKIERNQNKSSDDDETQNAVLVIDNSSLYHDVVKIASGNFEGYYAVITEGENLMNLQINDEIEINYLKKSSGKWIVAPHDLDSRMIIDLKKVNGYVDSRSRYTITEI